VHVVVREQRADPVELVEQLLEPQLVDLVDDDEEHFIVLRPFGPELLELEQLVDLQVAAVGHRGGFVAAHGAELYGGSGPGDVAGVSAV
jgi:hypothetical protein